MSADYRQQQEQDEHQQFLWYEGCVYCGRQRPEERFRSCCGEMHFEMIEDEENEQS